MDSLNFNSVETLPGFEARAAFTVNSATVFREDVNIVPTIVDDSLSYIPCGGDNNMPFDNFFLKVEASRISFKNTDFYIDNRLIINLWRT